jgi:hypothetical protein
MFSFSREIKPLLTKEKKTGKTACSVAHRVQSSFVCSALACCMAGPSLNLGSAPPGRFFPPSNMQRRNGERPRRVVMDKWHVIINVRTEKGKINKKSDSSHQTLKVLINEKRGGLSVVSFDRSPLKLFSLKFSNKPSFERPKTAPRTLFLSFANYNCFPITLSNATTFKPHLFSLVNTFTIVNLPMKRALARLTLILQPPENLLVALCCISLLKPRPASRRAALGSAWSAPIARSSSYTSCSFSVVSLPPFPFSCSQGWKKPGFIKKKKTPAQWIFWVFWVFFINLPRRESF